VLDLLHGNVIYKEHYTH